MADRDAGTTLAEIIGEALAKALPEAEIRAEGMTLRVAAAADAAEAALLELADGQPIHLVQRQRAGEGLRYALARTGSNGTLDRLHVDIDRATASTTPGAFAVLLGPDGCGKTTVLAGIGHCWEPLLGRYQPFHLHPRLGESKSAKPRPGFDPHAKPPRGTLASLAKLVMLLGQYRVGDLVAVRPIVRAGGLAVFDRYFHDLLVDPARFRYGGPAGLPRTMLPLLPLPDLVMLLDGPAEVLHARKPELEPAVIDGLRQRYRAAIGDRAIIVDVDRTPAEVCHTVHRLLLATLHRQARAAILADAARQAR